MQPTDDAAELRSRFFASPHADAHTRGRRRRVESLSAYASAHSRQPSRAPFANLVCREAARFEPT